MKRLLIPSIASLAVLLLGTADRAAAQGSPNYFPQYSSAPYPLQSPLSPMMNLLQNRSAAVNYFLGVVPDQARRYAAQQLTTPEIIPTRRPVIDEADDFIPRLPETGHAVRFLSYGTYYNLPNAQGQRPSNFLNPLGYQQGALPPRPATTGTPAPPR
jgi:hypothetical protein